MSGEPEESQDVAAAELESNDTGMRAGFFAVDDWDLRTIQLAAAQNILEDSDGSGQPQALSGVSCDSVDDEDGSGASVKKEKTPWAMDLLFQGTGSLSYSSLGDGGQMVGGKGAVVVAPVVKFDEKKSAILLYSGAYRKTKQIFVQDEGPRLFSEDIVQNVIPTYRYRWSPKLIISPSVVYTEVRVKETAEDTWNNGLYNYLDVGGSVKAEYLLEAGPKGKRSVCLGVQRFRREYPNFRSLASIAGYGSFEEREKDFDGILVTLKHTKKRPTGWSNTVKASFLDKRFSDKLVENETGGRDPRKQYDFTINLQDGLQYTDGTGWGFSLDSSLAYTSSNQNMTEGAFPLTVFHRNYYSSYSVSLRPGCCYTQRLPSGRLVTYCGEYGITRHAYVDRRVKDRNGQLLADSQVDWTHNLSLKGIWTLNKHWSFGITLDYTKVISNMHYEQLYRYNYEIMNVAAGFSCRY